MIDLGSCENEYRKACEKYGSTSPKPTPDAATVKRRWRAFVIIELLLVICFAALLLFGRGLSLGPALIVVLAFWLIVTLPIAFSYVIGKPMVLRLDLDGDSDECRAMSKEISRRNRISEDEFYQRFYDGSGIERETIGRIRKLLRRRIDSRADRLVPTDYLPLFWEWLDFADVFTILGREFEINLGHEGSFNGTLDGLIRLVDDGIRMNAMRNGAKAAR